MTVSQELREWALYDSGARYPTDALAWAVLMAFRGGVGHYCRWDDLRTFALLVAEALEN